MGRGRVVENPEQWRKYKDTPYEVSDEGNIRRLYKRGYKEISGFTSHKFGHQEWYVHMRYGEKRKIVPIKKVVWETFRGEVPEGYLIRHKNGCKSMNDVYNLELVSKSDFGKQTGTQRAYTYCLIRDKNTGKEYVGYDEASKGLYTGRDVIYQNAKGITKNATVNVEIIGKVTRCRERKRARSVEGDFL